MAKAAVAGLSLFDIEIELHNLLERWQEADTAEEMQAVETEIEIWAAKELQKVDGLRSYMVFARAQAKAAADEAKAQTNRSRAWQARYDRLEAFVTGAMNLTGRKELVGRTGGFKIQGNGGVAPLSIVSEALVPDNLCKFTGSIPGALYVRISEVLGKHDPDSAAVLATVLKREASNSAVREALAQPCPECDASGCTPMDQVDEKGKKWRSYRLDKPCSACAGSGTAGVPGARLEPRGEQLRIV